MSPPAIASAGFHLSGGNGEGGQREGIGTKPFNDTPEDAGRVLAEVQDNHESHKVIRFDPPITTDRLEILLSAPSPEVPAALFEVRCYGR